jgi:hypothetical protein
MRKEERTIYITDDDEEFTDWVSARDHERVRAVRKVLDSSDICWRDTCSVEAAAVIVNSYLLLTPAVASAGANLLDREWTAFSRASQTTPTTPMSWSR